RFRAHSMYAPELYRDRAEVEAWTQRDPIPALAGLLREAGALDDPAMERLEAGVAAEVAAAVEFAEAGTLEPVEELTRFVHSEARGQGRESPRPA
ncbi:MAG TPA: thiamine pyrophosphate-dependent enzyme, partial [Longimicrobiaceae bacterium]|nr:thiamine pyrophosphate-dependent enzyme [Longimicrobiaceae bacterium]